MDLLNKVSVLAVKQCHRQQVGLDRLATLIAGYHTVMSTWGSVDDFAKLHLSDRVKMVTELGYQIEPDNKGVPRRTPVTFRNGGTAAPGHLVEDLLRDWVWWLSVARRDSEAISATIPLTQEFLWIHPFTDGNGRTAWVLYNWMTDQMNDPVDLPQFDWIPRDN